MAIGVAWALVIHVKEKMSSGRLSELERVGTCQELIMFSRVW